MKKITFYIIMLSFAFGCNSQIENVKEVKEENNIAREVLNEWQCDDCISKKPLVFLSGNDTVWCDNAQTTLDINLCSYYDVCFEMKRLDSLNEIIIRNYDFESAEQKKYGPSEFPEDNIDFENLKSIHKESINKYLEYCELEKDKDGIPMGEGRARIFYENYRRVQLLEILNKDLQKQVDYINE